MIESLLVEEGLGTSMWRELSAIVHSRDSNLLLMIDPWEGHHEAWLRNRDVARMGIAALAALHEVVPRLETYLGWSLEALSDSEDDSILLLLWSAGAGLHDASIRDYLRRIDEQ